MSIKKHNIEVLEKMFLDSVEDIRELYVAFGYSTALGNNELIKHGSFQEIMGLSLALGEIYDTFPEHQRTSERFKFATRKTIESAFEKVYEIEEVQK